MNPILHGLQHLGPLAVFAVVLLEQVGLPVPGYAALVVAGAGTAADPAGALRLLAAALLAAVLADAGWYLAGQRFGSRLLRRLCGLSLEPDSCVGDTERTFNRFGLRVLLVAKFVPGLGAVATAMSGVVAAPLLLFLVLDALGALLWGGSALALGWVFHAAVDDALATLASYGRLGLLLLVAFAAGAIGLKYWRRRRLFLELRMNRISVAELLELLSSGAAPTIIDARPGPARARDGMIPGALPVESLEAGSHGLSPEIPVVVYCACPNEVTAARVARRLKSLGFVHVRPLAGGIHAWIDAGQATQAA